MNPQAVRTSSVVSDDFSIQWAIPLAGFCVLIGMRHAFMA